MRGKSISIRNRLFWSFMKTRRLDWGATYDSYVAALELKKAYFFKAFDDFESGVFTSDRPFYLQSRLFISEAMKNLKSNKSRGLKVLSFTVDDCCK